MTNPDLEGVPLRELRLPLDVLFLADRARRARTIVPSGHTVLHLGDEVSVVDSGRASSTRSACGWAARTDVDA